MTTSNGPWSYDAESGLVLTKDMTGVWLGSTTGDSSAIVCQVESHDGVSNGDLIAAAPDMRDALRLIIEWEDREQDHAVEFWDRAMLCRMAMDAARAALAKAER